MRVTTQPGRWPAFGRWAWIVLGLAAGAALGIPGARLIVRAGDPSGGDSAQPVATRTVTVSQSVTSLALDSYGAAVHVMTGQVSRVTVTESLSYDPSDGAPPPLRPSVSGDRASVADPVCSQWAECIGFAVIVPRGVSVSVESEDGLVSISGTAGAYVDSGGAPVHAVGITGPLTVISGGGPVIINGLTGPMSVDTGGGDLNARNIAGADVNVSTGGGPARIGFVTAPEAVTVSTDGGPATLAVPGGPYQVTAESSDFGGPVSIEIPVDPAAHRVIDVSSGGGPLVIRHLR